MGRRALVLVVALLLAGVAAFAIFQYLNGVEEDILAGQVQVPVFRAVQPIAEGTSGNIVLSSPGQLFIDGFEQKEDLPADAITTQEQLQSVLQNRVAAGPISQNAILTQSQWVEETVDVTPLRELIGEGKQALTIDPGLIQGVNGFVEPGDRVNVIVSVDIEARLIPSDNPPDFGIPTEGAPASDTSTPSGSESQTVTVPYTRFVLQGVPVLAVGRDTRPAEDQPVEVTVPTNATQGEGEGQAQEIVSVYTLEVTPEQAERLVFALENGSIYLTLVPEDFVEISTKGITIETLFEGDLVEDIFSN